MSEEDNIFTFRIWSGNGDWGAHIGWAWVAIIAVIVVWVAL